MSEQRPKHQTMRLLTHHLHYVKFKKSKPFSSFVSVEASGWQANAPPAHCLHTSAASFLDRHVLLH